MKITDPEVAHLQQVHWAIQFAQEMDLEKSRRDLLKIRLHEFVRESSFHGASPGEHQVFNPAGDLEAFVGLVTDDRLIEIHREIKKALAAFADESFFAMELSEKASKRVGFQWQALLPHYRFGQSVSISQDPISQVLLALGLHVEHSGLTGERIRRCARSGCDRIFLRERAPQKGRDQFCSLACARLAAKRRYLEREEKKGAKLTRANPLRAPSADRRAKTKKKRNR